MINNVHKLYPCPLLKICITCKSIKFLNIFRKVDKKYLIIYQKQIWMFFNTFFFQNLQMFPLWISFRSDISKKNIHVCQKRNINFVLTWAREKCYSNPVVFTKAHYNMFYTQIKYNSLHSQQSFTLFIRLWIALIRLNFKMLVCSVESSPKDKLKWYMDFN